MRLPYEAEARDLRGTAGADPDRFLPEPDPHELCALPTGAELSPFAVGEVMGGLTPPGPYTQPRLCRVSGELR